MDSRARTYLEYMDYSNRNQGTENVGTKIIGTGTPGRGALESGDQA